MHMDDVRPLACDQRVERGRHARAPRLLEALEVEVVPQDPQHAKPLLVGLDRVRRTPGAEGPAHHRDLVAEPGHRARERFDGALGAARQLGREAVQDVEDLQSDPSGHRW